jgi:hypothetical protein
MCRESCRNGSEGLAVYGPVVGAAQKFIRDRPKRFHRISWKSGSGGRFMVMV